MDWLKGEPPHAEGAEILGWWDKSKCYAVIEWSIEDQAWIEADARCVMSSPTHYAVLTPPES